MRFALFSVLALVFYHGFSLDFKAAIPAAEGYGKSDLEQDPIWELKIASFPTTFVGNTSDLGHTSFQGSFISSSYCSSSPYYCQDEFLGLDVQSLLRGQQRGGELLPSMWRSLGVLASQWRWWILEAGWSTTVADLAGYQKAFSSGQSSGSWSWWSRPSSQVPQETEGWWKQRRESRPQEPQESIQGPWEGKKLLQRAWRQRQRPIRRTSLGSSTAASCSTACPSCQCGSSDFASRSAAEIHGQDHFQRFGLLSSRTSR